MIRDPQATLKAKIRFALGGTEAFGRGGKLKDGLGFEYLARMLPCQFTYR